jgi:hypothetical protein
LHGLRGFPPTDWAPRLREAVACRRQSAHARDHSRANDPIRGEASRCPGRARKRPTFLLEQPDEGGHVGFLSGPGPRQCRLLPRRLLTSSSTGISRHIRRPHSCDPLRASAP